MTGILVAPAAANGALRPHVVNITTSRFGSLIDGTAVDLYTLATPGLEVRAITLGGIITGIHTPDRLGRMANIVLAHETLEPYVNDTAYLGAVVGRYANRVAHGRVDIGGRPCQLTLNNGRHHLHGGARGFNRYVWAARSEQTADTVAVEFSRVSPDGEQGYPGTLEATVRYELHRNRALTIEYWASTTAPTIVNMTQHTYFNLSAADDDVLGHELSVAADEYTPVDAELIPTGQNEQVEGTPFDFRSTREVGQRIDEPHPQLLAGQGYDHNFVLRGGGLRQVAVLRAPDGGRTLEVATTEPGIQVYSGNQLEGPVSGADGRTIRKRSGICLETQHFPDSPHHPAFPSTELRPGEFYRSSTRWRFGVGEW